MSRCRSTQCTFWDDDTDDDDGEEKGGERGDIPTTTACRPSPPGIGAPHNIPDKSDDADEDEDLLDDIQDTDDETTIPPIVWTLMPYGDTVHTLPPPTAGRGRRRLEYRRYSHAMILLGTANASIANARHHHPPPRRPVQ